MKNNIWYSLIRWIVSMVRQTTMRLLKSFRRMRRTKAQLLVQDRFREAADYAKAQMLDPEMKALYETGVNKKRASAYAVAFRDALTPPEVLWLDTGDYHGQAGDRIVVCATDDFKVEHVTVTIINGEGKVIESGEAVEDDVSPSLWSYAVSSANDQLTGTLVSVRAFDLPGNQGVLARVLCETDIPLARRRDTAAKLSRSKSARSIGNSERGETAKRKSVPASRPQSRSARRVAAGSEL
jgi:hypothetical protein